MQAIKQFTLSLAFLIGSISFCQGQNLQLTSLEMVLSEMAFHNIYESDRIGFTASKSKQYERYQYVVATATTEQLLDLAANHQNAVVRLYVFHALKQKKAYIPEELIKKFKADTTKVTIQNGCIRDIKPVSFLATGG